MALSLTNDELIRKTIANRAKAVKVATPLKTTKVATPLKTNTGGAFGEAYRKNIGYNTKNLPTYRPDQPKPTSLIGKVFDTFNKVNSGAMYPLAKSYSDFKKARDTGQVGKWATRQVPRAIFGPVNAYQYAKDFYKGASGDINYTGKSVVSQAFDDPTGVRSSLGTRGKKVIDNNAVRAGIGFVGEVAFDPTNVIPIGAVTKPIKGISKAVGLTDNVIKPLAKGIENVDGVRNVLKKFGALTPKADKEMQMLLKTNKAVSAELSDLTFKTLRGEVKPRNIAVMKAYGESMVERTAKAAGLPSGVVKTTLKKFNTELDDAVEAIARIGNVDQKLLQRHFVGAVAPGEIVKDYATIAKPFRTLEKEIVTEGLVKSKIISREIAEKYPNYARKFYEETMSQGNIEELNLIAKGSKKMGPEIKLTNLSKGEELRVMEYLADHPEFLLKTPKSVIKTAGVNTLTKTGKSSKTLRTILGSAMKYDTPEAFIKSVADTVTTNKKGVGRLFDVAKLTDKDIAGLVGKSTKELGLRKEIAALRKAKDYKGIENLIFGNLFKSPDEVFGALRSAGYKQYKPYAIPLNTNSYIKLDVDKDMLKYLFSTPEGTLREIWQSTWDNAGVSGLVGEFNKRVGKGVDNLSLKNQVAESFRPHLNRVLGDEIPLIANEQRAIRGMIEDASVTIAKTFEQGFNRITAEDFLRYTAQTHGKTAEELGEALATGKFKQIPLSKRYGELSGKYVPDYIHDDVVGILSNKNNWLSKATNMWKQIKLFSPLNFASVARNQPADMVMNSMVEGGPTIVRQFELLPRAIKEVQDVGPAYREMLKKGVFANTYAGAEGTKELSKQMKRVPNGGIANTIEGGVDKLTSLNVKTIIPGIGAGKDAYQYVAEVNKVVQVIHQMEKNGKSLDEAIEMAAKATFDYNNLPTGLTGFRDNFMPFMTFKYFAIQLAWDTLINRTSKIGMLPKVTRAVENLSEPQPGEEGSLPEYMQRDRPFYVRLPGQKEDGTSKYLNLKNTYPFGDVASFSPLDIMTGNPFVRTPLEIAKNESFYFKQPIADKFDSRGQRALDYGKYALEQLGPKPGLREAGQLKDALTGAPDRYGRTRDLPSTALNLGLGIKTADVDIQRNNMFRYYDKKGELDEIEKKAKSIMRDQSLSERERQKELDRLKKLYQKTINNQ